MIFQFKIKRHSNNSTNSEWNNIDIDYEIEFKSIMTACSYALTTILGQDKKREIQEIRLNLKGSLQGHYIAGFSKLTWSFMQSGKLYKSLPDDGGDNDYLAATYSSSF